MYMSSVGAPCAALRAWRLHALSFSGLSWFCLYSSWQHTLQSATTDGGDNTDCLKIPEQTIIVGVRKTSIKLSYTIRTTTWPIQTLASSTFYVGNIFITEMLVCGWRLKT